METHESERKDVRPISVVLFEAINILLVVVPILFPDGDRLGDILGLIVITALTLWITRGRSKLGRLVYTLLTVFAVAAVTAAIALGYIPGGLPIYPLLLFAFEVAVLLALLWSPSTSSWLSRRSMA